MACNVCVVGSINMDLVVSAPRFPEPGETVLGTEYEIHPGGKGANQAVAASRLGAKVTFVGAVGDDDWGSKLRGVLAAEGIDLHHLRTCEGRASGVGLITVLPDGRNGIVVAPGANATLSADDVVAAAQAIRAADVLLLQGEVPPEVDERAIEIARETGTEVILNAAPADGIDPALLRHVDLLIVNESEARALLSVDHRDVSASGIARRLASLGPERLVITLGEEGAIHFDGKELVTFDSFPVACVDSTGAGDAFVAAVAVLRAEGARVKEVLRTACAAGALATTGTGAIPSLATRAAVDSFLESSSG